MSQFIKNGIVLISLIIAVVLLVYFAYASLNKPLALLTSDKSTSLIGSTVSLNILASLRIITLDNSIFSDPAFISLIDFGVVIPEEPVGRRNPFAPVQSIVISTASSSGAKTSAPRNIGR